MPILETIWSDNWKLYAQATFVDWQEKYCARLLRKIHYESDQNNKGLSEFDLCFKEDLICGFS
jgi:hypothetical protein